MSGVSNTNQVSSNYNDKVAKSMVNHLKRRDNISTIFLLPSLKFDEVTRAKFYPMGFENTYLFSDVYTYPFKHLFVVFKFKDYMEETQKFIAALQRNPNFVETQELTGGRTLFVYKIPDQYIKDYELFLEGKYSKFSKDYKSNFPMKVYVTNSKGSLIMNAETGRFMIEDSVFYHIFNRTDYLKKIYKDFLSSNEYDEIELPDELYDKYIEKEEILKP